METAITIMGYIGFGVSGFMVWGLGFRACQYSITLRNYSENVVFIIGLRRLQLCV